MRKTTVNGPFKRTNTSVTQEWNGSYHLTDLPKTLVHAPMINKKSCLARAVLQTVVSLIFNTCHPLPLISLIKSQPTWFDLGS